MPEVLWVTVSGPSGSGTSTLVGRLQTAYGWSATNGGVVFRAAAEERGVSLAAFGALAREEVTIDLKLDARLRTHMRRADGPDIVESRLAGWWAYLLGSSAPRIWLDAPLEVRAARVRAREGGELATRMAEVAARDEVDALRYRTLYGFDPADLLPYTLIVDARAGAGEVAAEVLAHLAATSPEVDA